MQTCPLCLCGFGCCSAVPLGSTQAEFAGICLITPSLLIFSNAVPQVSPLVKAGYRVIAPDLRGGLGGETDSPQEPEAYDIPKCIVKDVAGTWLGLNVADLAFNYVVPK